MGMGLGQEGVLSTLQVALPQLLSVLFRLSVSLHTHTTHACSHARAHAHTHPSFSTRPQIVTIQSSLFGFE